MGIRKCHNSFTIFSFWLNTWSTISFKYLLQDLLQASILLRWFSLLFGIFQALSRQSHHECSLSVGPDIDDYPRKHCLPHSLRTRNSNVLSCRTLEITCPENFSCRRARLTSVVGLVAPSCWNYVFATRSELTVMVHSWAFSKI